MDVLLKLISAMPPELITKLKGLIPTGTTEANGLLKQQVLSPEAIRALAQTLLAVDPDADLKAPDHQIFNELEFFKSNDLTAAAPITYFQSLCRATSQTGILYLKHLLIHVQTSLAVLHERQAVLRMLSELSPARKQGLLRARAWFTQAEGVIYWNIGDKTPEMREVLDMLFFTKAWNRRLNTHEGFMGVYYYFVMLISPVWGVVSPFLFFFVPYIVARYIMKLPIPFEYYISQMKEMLFGKQFFTMLKMAQKVFESMFMDKESIKGQLISKIFDIITGDLGRYMYMLFIVGSYLYGIYSYIVSSMNYNKLLNFVHERVNALRTLVDNTVLCIDSLQEMRKHLPELNALCEACLERLNGDPLIQMLREHGIFTTEPFFLSNKGVIIKTYYLLEQADKKEVFKPFIRLMAWVDCWLGCDELRVAESFSFAEWDVVSETPKLDIEEVWSPVGGKVSNTIGLWREPGTALSQETSPETALSQETSPGEVEDKPETEQVEDKPETEQVEDKVELDVKEEVKVDPETEKEEAIAETEDKAESIKPNCLLTGPNGSGKSTFLKSVMSSVLLAQTIGIVPAKRCRMTPFTYVSTYLNIPDCQGKESLFQAEMRRCHDHLNTLKQLETTGGFSFNIMDEIFVSTNYKEGISGAYGVIKALEKYPHSLNIITTHFDKLTTCSLPSFCYKHFSIQVDPATEKLTRDYKLKPGVNKQHMALELLKQKGFDTELIKNAKNMLADLV